MHPSRKTSHGAWHSLAGTTSGFAKEVKSVKVVSGTSHFPTEPGFVALFAKQAAAVATVPAAGLNVITAWKNVLQHTKMD